MGHHHLLASTSILDVCQKIYDLFFSNREASLYLLLYPSLCISAPPCEFAYLPWETYVCVMDTCAVLRKVFANVCMCVFFTILRSLGEKGHEIPCIGQGRSFPGSVYI